MFIRLTDVAKINSGLVVSRKKAALENDIVASYKQLNFKAIGKNGNIIESELEKLDSKDIINSTYLTQEGDIVFRLTEPFTASYITNENTGLVITSNFCVIKTTHRYNAKFLYCYLNSPQAKKAIMGSTQGSIMKNVSISELEKLQVPNFSMDKMHKISELLLSQIEKIQILEELKRAEEKRLNAVLKNFK